MKTAEERADAEMKRTLRDHDEALKRADIRFKDAQNRAEAELKRVRDEHDLVLTRTRDEH